MLVRGVVAEDQLAECLYSGITLHADADGEVALAGAVIFKARGGEELLDDERFLGVIGRDFFGAGAAVAEF